MDPKETQLKQIRTFQGDVAEALQRQQESLVSIQRREHLKNPGQFGNDGSSQNSGKKGGFVFLFLGSLLLVTVGVVGAWLTYDKFIGKVGNPTITAPTNRFLSPNTEINLEPKLDSRSSLVESLSGAIESVPDSEIRHINLIKKTVAGEVLLSTSEFLKTLESQAPGNLVRAFEPLFMFGILGDSTIAGGASTFLIIKLASFENAFAGMLTWEENLGHDLGSLFATSALLKNTISEAEFTDVTDRNKDIRILTVADQPAILYSFFDNDLLIITDSIKSLHIIIERLAREKLSR